MPQLAEWHTKLMDPETPLLVKKELAKNFALKLRHYSINGPTALLDWPIPSGFLFKMISFDESVLVFCPPALIRLIPFRGDTQVAQ